MRMFLGLAWQIDAGVLSWMINMYVCKSGLYVNKSFYPYLIETNLCLRTSSDRTKHFA